MVFTIYKARMNPKAFEDAVTATVILNEVFFSCRSKVALENSVAVSELSNFFRSRRKLSLSHDDLAPKTRLLKVCL